MTMVAACLFPDGAVVIADSRATWADQSKLSFQDTLQKILFLSPKLAIGFSGNVQIAASVVGHLRQRIQSRSRFRVPEKLALEIPRVARHYHGQARTGRVELDSLALILAGINSSEKVKIWCFESPRFYCQELSLGFIVAGSGSVVRSYLEGNLERIARDTPDLKARADALLVGLAGELERHGLATVGGMLQVIMLNREGVRPLRHGFMILNPEATGHGRYMEMRDGRWIQTDVTSGREIPLREPFEVLRTSARELRVHDFKPATGEQSIPKWHLTYLITCCEVRYRPGTIEFRGVMSALGSVEFPVTVSIVATVGLWGSPGEHMITCIFEQDGIRTTLKEDKLKIGCLAVEVDYAAEISLFVQKPGSAFLEVTIGGQILGRRALFFGRIPGPLPDDPTAREKVVREHAEWLQQQQAEQSDPVLEKAVSTELVYLSLCQNCVDQGMVLKFEEQAAVVFWKRYPLKLRIFIASAFRMTRGEHSVRVDLVNAATGKSSTVTTATVVARSSFSVTPIHGELIVVVPEPGVYFFNVYVDNKLVGSVILPAETESPRYSYILRDVETARVASGELLILVKRSIQQPESKQ